MIIKDIKKVLEKSIKRKILLLVIIEPKKIKRRPSRKG
jgi:hypothetical protein